MIKKIDYDFFVWCSDFENYRGEGILARSFLKKIILAMTDIQNVKKLSKKFLFFLSPFITILSFLSESRFF